MIHVPPFLQEGDRIAVVAISRRIFPDQMDHAREIFSSWGLQLAEGDHLFDADGYLAGTDEHRLADLQKMINDPDIKAIFLARGGYGATRIIDQLSVQTLKEHPKWIIGFSDVTALHVKLEQARLTSVHGLMPVQFAYDGIEKSLNSLHDWLFHGKLQYSFSANKLNRHGNCNASVIGGNLSLLADSLGTQTEIETSGKILLIEEVDEYLYKIDRMMTQLQRAGKFQNLKGVIIGDFSDIKDTEIPFGYSVFELLQRYFSGDYPLAFGLPFGHEHYNLAIPLGIPVKFDVAPARTVLRYHPSDRSS